MTAQRLVGRWGKVGGRGKYHRITWVSPEGRMAQGRCGQTIMVGGERAEIFVVQVERVHPDDRCKRCTRYTRQSDLGG